MPERQVTAMEKAAAVVRGVRRQGNSRRDRRTQAIRRLRTAAGAAPT